ncbi:hypothetical protein HK101_002111 [Irineochytrium annulatum]|nr:hypothetical protein HK101_002111 [Irineochytrium annulatum]
MNNSVDVEQHKGDSLNTSIADLAKDARKDETESRPKIHLPLSVLVISLLLVGLAAVCIPLATILSSSSASTINDLSTVIMQESTERLVTRVQDVLAVPFSLISLTISNLPLRRAITTNYNNLQNELLKTETDTFSFLSDLSFTSPYINGIACATYPNLFTPGAPLVMQAPNTTFLASYRNASGSSASGALYMDFSTEKMLWGRWFDPTSYAFTPAVKVPNYPVWDYAMPSFMFFTAMVTNPSPKPFISFSFNEGTLIFGVNLMYIPPGSTKPTYSCSIGVENQASLGSLFESIKITANSRILMIDVNTGMMLASSTPNSLFHVTNFTDPTLPAESWTIATTNDTYANMIGKALIGSYGNYSGVPNTGLTVTLQNVQIGDGQPWFINMQYLDQPSNWLLIVAIPRADFFANTDAANRKALIISIAVSALGLIISAVIAFFALRPLYGLAKAMELLTSMDFKALEGNILTRRSFISEVRVLQVTFSTMCKAFASGIRRNQMLTRAKFTTAGQGSQMGSTVVAGEQSATGF